VNEEGIPIQSTDRLTEILKVTRKKIFKIKHRKLKYTDERREALSDNKYNDVSNDNSEEKDLNMEENNQINDYMYSNEGNGAYESKPVESELRVNQDENDNVNSSNEEILQENNAKTANDHPRINDNDISQAQHNNSNPPQQDEEIQGHGVDNGEPQAQEETVGKENAMEWREEAVEKEL